MEPQLISSEEDDRILASTREVCSREVLPVRAELDEKQEFPEGVFSVFRQVGLFAAMMEEPYGGLGLSPLTSLRIAETVAEHCLGVATSFYASVCLAAFPIKLGGTEEQKLRYLPRLASGEALGAFAVTEPEAGSDILSLSTTAERRGDSWVLNGVKQWITNAGKADLYCVFAQTGGRGRISCFVVESGTPGLTFGEVENKLGIRCSHTRQVFLDDVEVPGSALVGLEENQGLVTLFGALARSRIGVAALSVGLATGAYREAVAYARQRKQFGRSLVRFQALQHMLAEALVGIEAARSLTYRACARAASGRDPTGLWAAMAKYHASETAMRVATDAVQIHGGNGFSKDYPVEKMFRDAKVLAIYEGTSQMLMNQIGDEIARSDPREPQT